MSKVIAIIGKVASGKTYYARELMYKRGGVLLSEDELFHDLFPGVHPKNQRETMEKIENYLLKKAVEIVRSGTDVILDWGFWKKKEREEITERFNSVEITTEWHYMDVSDEQWIENISKRNSQNTIDGASFHLDEEILRRVNEQFEVPARTEKVLIIKR